MPTKRKKPTRATKSIGTKAGAPEQRGASVSDVKKPDSRKQRKADSSRGANRQATPVQAVQAEQTPHGTGEETKQNNPAPQIDKGAPQAVPGSASAPISAPSTTSSSVQTTDAGSVVSQEQPVAQTKPKNKKPTPRKAPTTRKSEKRQLKIPFFNEKEEDQPCPQPHDTHHADASAQEPPRVPYRDPAPMPRDIPAEPKAPQPPTARQNYVPQQMDISRQNFPGSSQQEIPSQGRFAGLKNKVHMPQFVVPSFKRGEIPAKEHMRPSEFISLYRNRILAVIIAVLLTALVALAGYMYWDYYLRYDDALDIQGPWHTEAGVPVFIDEENINMPDDVTYAYALDTKEKTITYTFAKLSGGGTYEFSPERNMLIITEGEGDKATRVILIRDTSKDTSLEDKTKDAAQSDAKAEAAKPKPEPAPKPEPTPEPEPAPEPEPEYTDDTYVEDSDYTEEYSEDVNYEDEYYEEDYYEEEYYGDEYTEEEYYDTAPEEGTY